MKRSKEEAGRWLQQAEYDLDFAKRIFEQSFHAYTCFMCEQSAQKSLKSYLIFKGERYVWEHSIQKLAEICSNYDCEFSKVNEMGKILDKYYLTTRYPDAIAPPAIPYQSFTEKEAKEAIAMTDEIINLVKRKVHA